MVIQFIHNPKCFCTSPLSERLAVTFTPVGRDGSNQFGFHASFWKISPPVTLSFRALSRWDLSPFHPSCCQGGGQWFGREHIEALSMPVISGFSILFNGISKPQIFFSQLFVVVPGCMCGCATQLAILLFSRQILKLAASFSCHGFLSLSFLWPSALSWFKWGDFWTTNFWSLCKICLEHKHFSWH